MIFYPQFAKDIETLHPAHLLTLEDKAKAEKADAILTVIAAEWKRRETQKASEAL